MTNHLIKIDGSFIILHNSLFIELVKPETKLSVKTKKKVSNQELQLLKGR